MSRIRMRIAPWIAALGILAGQAGASEVIAHWDFNEIVDGKVPDRTGRHDAILVDASAADTVVPGVWGGALRIRDGRPSLRVPHDEALSLRDDFTVQLIIRPENVRGFRTILFKGTRKVVPERINYVVDMRDGKPELKAKDAEGNWQVFATSPIIEDGEWRLIQISYRNGAARIWVDGKLEGTRRQEPGRFENGFLPNEEPLLIGIGRRGGNIPAYPYSGLIDEIRIIDGALDEVPAELLDQWNERLNAYDAEAEVRAADAVVDRLLGEVAALGTHAPEGPECADLEAIAGELRVLKSRPPATRAEAVGALRTRFHRAAFDAFWAGLSGEDGDAFRLATLPASERILPVPLFIKDLRGRNERISLEAAGNEREGFQAILVAPHGKAVTSVEVEPGTLTSDAGDTIPAANLCWGWVRNITTEKPEYAVDYIGPIPDAIMEDGSPFGIPAGGFTPVYVRIAVPAGTTPGIYRGEVAFRAGGTEQRARIELRVHDFTLAEKSTLKLAYSFFEKFYAEWYGWESVPEERQRYLYDFLLSYRITPNNIYDGKETYPALKYLKDYADEINFFTYAHRAINKPVSEEALASLLDKAEATHETLKAEGLADRGYIYLYDELWGHRTPERLKAAAQLLNGLQQRIPDAKLMQTSFPVEGIRDLFNVWSPIFSEFASSSNRALFDELRARGDEMWWYSADKPNHPFPNFFLDYPVFDCRIIMTLSYMYDVEGVLYWCINREWKTNVDAETRWPEGEWKPYIFHISRGTRKYKNGMGNFMYPGPDGQILPSLRLENVRDGVEDYEYLVALKKALASLEGDASGRAKALSKRGTALLTVPAEVARTVGDWSSDPADLLAYRSKIAKTIDAIAAYRKKN